MEEKEKEINQLGYKMIEYINANNIIIEDCDGYKYKVGYHDLVKRGKIPVKIFKKSIFLRENLDTYLRINAPKCHITSIKLDEEKEISFTCDNHPEKGEMKTSIKNIQNKRRMNGTICRHCGYEMGNEKNRTTFEQIDNECKRLGIQYINHYREERHTMIEFICPIHKDKGIQVRTWDSLKNAKNSCIYCSPTHKMSHEEFMESLDERILYQLKVVGKYTGNENDIECKCLKCNRNWTQTANNLKRGNGCPYCNESKGEKEVRRILEKYEIPFNEQHTFDDCRYIKKLRFDFYIEKYNIAIEYQGVQHYEPVRFNGSKNIDENLEFEENVKRDKIKKDYCKKNNIKLLCIHYNDYESIEEIILNELKLPLTK